MENGPLNKRITIENEEALLEVSTGGGAITSFQLRTSRINPLNFAFSRSQMPPNNRKGAPFRGHFVCIGRWGPPSTGEIKSGVPDHGDFVAISWILTACAERSITMEAVSDLEGLHVRRHIALHSSAAMVHVSEEITNIRPLGRFINIVQHPTIAAPFLTPGTRVFCNATNGYNYASYDNPAETASLWPSAGFANGHVHDISYSCGGRTAVHAFVIRKTDEFGWVCATDPQSHLLLGYVWRRSQYPWINHWCDYADGAIRYRGLEFGTTGMHQPFATMLSTGNTNIFGEPVLAFIDAGETIEKSYTAFLAAVNRTVHDVEYISERCGQIFLSLNGQPVTLGSQVREDEETY